MISPTACGALFSARTTPQPSQNLVEPSWNPGEILVEPSWNLTSGPPRTTPEPIWAETPKLAAVGEKEKGKTSWKQGSSPLVATKGAHPTGLLIWGSHLFFVARPWGHPLVATGKKRRRGGCRLLLHDFALVQRDAQEPLSLLHLASVRV